MCKIIINAENVYCPDGSHFIGASCLGKELTMLNLPEGSEYFKYHIRFTGLNADDLEVGKYEVTYSEIHLDTREPFASKRIVRINPISCTKIE